MNKFIFDELPSAQLRLIQNGGVGVLPTDTIYGIVTQVRNTDSVKRLYSLKSRENKPGTIIASSIQQIIDLGVDPSYVEKVRVFWPNPISIIIPVDDSLSHVHLGMKSLAFRVVSDPEIAKLLDKTGPLLTSSANEPGKPVASTIKEAAAYFGSQVDFYIDGDNLANSAASAVIMIDENGVKILRDSPKLQELSKSIEVIA
ncbi:MAG: L-threonylcarbamoyladenylate synthase [Candidatus Saccharibacteria bacterium]|nr:L-threonylcarbamoyladenylate synthase [Candidatus Saccharibacteria bacterium]